MAPNLFVLAQTAVKPHRWFRSSTPEISLARTEHWEEPVPGVYRHTPGCGWALIAVEEEPEMYRELEHRKKVVYCRCMHRYIFQDEFESRKMQGYYLDRPTQKKPLTFYRLDDDVTWVQCFDKDGGFISGPYQRMVLDADTGKFRTMLKADDPQWQARRVSASSANSAMSSLHCSSGANSSPMSRNSSFQGLESSQSRPASSANTLLVPGSDQSRKSSSSRSSSRGRPVRVEELPHL